MTEIDLSSLFRFPAGVEKILHALGEIGKPRIAGGAVRDALLGKEPKDLDVEVFACEYDTLVDALQAFGRVDCVGRSFGVIKLRVGRKELDFAIPRTEKKVCGGHQGFEVYPDPYLEERVAAARRDFTINAISWDPLEGRLIDPFGGVEDLRSGYLRHTSEAFAEDPLRVLRGFQFVSRFNLVVAPETLELCRSMVDTFPELARERVWMEWKKWICQARTPSLGIRFLKDTGWLRWFPELAALDACPQDPEWHPEGDVLTHTACCMDALVNHEAWAHADESARLYLGFAVLCHDFGKPATTEKVFKNGRERWVSPGHDQVGGPLAEHFLQELTAPKALPRKVVPLVVNHMVAAQYQKKPSMAAIRRLARRLDPASIAELLLVIEADQRGRPPLSGEPSVGLRYLKQASSELQMLNESPRPLVQGRHLIERGYTAGPHFGAWLEALFEHQLSGDFQDMEGAEFYIKQVCDK